MGERGRDGGRQDRREGGEMEGGRIGERGRDGGRQDRRRGGRWREAGWEGGGGEMKERWREAGWEGGEIQGKERHGKSLLP